MIKVLGADALKELIGPLIPAEVGKPKAEPAVEKVAKPGKIGQMAKEKPFHFRRPRAAKKNGNPFITSL